MSSPSPLILREKLKLTGFLLVIWQCARGEVYGESVSAFPTCFDVVIFSFTQSVRVTHLVSGFLSEGVAVCVGVNLVHLWEQGSSGATYFIIQVPPLCEE